MGEPGLCRPLLYGLGRGGGGALAAGGLRIAGIASGSVADAIDTLAAIRAFEMSRALDRKPPYFSGGGGTMLPRAIAGARWRESGARDPRPPHRRADQSATGWRIRSSAIAAGGQSSAR